MNNNQIMSYVRQAMAFAAGTTIGAVLLSKIGLKPDDLSTVVDAVGVLVGVAGTVWSTLTHSKAATVASAAAIVPIPAASQAKVGIELPITPPLGK